MVEMLGNKIGAATVFGTLLDLDRDVQVIIDKDVTNEDYYGCSDGNQLPVTLNSELQILLISFYHFPNINP